MEAPSVSPPTPIPTTTHCLTDFALLEIQGVTIDKKRNIQKKQSPSHGMEKDIR